MIDKTPNSQNAMAAIARRLPIRASTWFAFSTLVVAVIAGACSDDPVASNNNPDASMMMQLGDGSMSGADGMPPKGPSGFIVTPNGPSADSLIIREGDSGQVFVSLKAAPQAPKVAMLSAGNGVQLLPSTLTFDASNYNLPQRVSISALQDTNTINETLKLTVTEASLDPGSVVLQILDDDVQSLLVTPGADLTVTEGGTETFLVRPAFIPVGGLSVAVVSGEIISATVSPSTLTFTEANYTTPQLVTVTGVVDANIADASVTLTLSAPMVASTTVSLTVIDRDTINIIASPSAVAITEGGPSQTVAVSLTKMPSATEAINVTVSDSTKASVSAATLTFTQANYATPQMVTITAKQDPDGANEAISVLFDFPALTSREVAVTITDDDVQNVLTSAASVSVNEGSTATLGVSLAVDPVVPLTVSVASSNTSAITVGSPTLTFTSANFSTPQMVTLTGVVDANVVSETVTLTLSAAGIAAKAVTMTAVDKDTLSIVASTTSATFSETGSSTISVSLGAAPASNTTVTVASSDTTTVTVSPATLTFTPANFASPQSVTLTGVTNAGTTARTATVSLASTGLTTVPVAVTVTDAAVQSFSVTPTTLALTEGAAPGTFTVKLSQAGNVTATIVSSNTAAATVSPASLTFTTANFGTAQTVTVTPIKDANTVPDAATISVAATGITTQSVSVNVADVDVQSIVVTPATLSVTEGATATFTARLAFAPAGSTSVSVTSANTAAVTASPTALTFTSANFATPQTVTLTGVADTNMTAEVVNVTLTTAGVPNATVVATTVDNTVMTCDAPGTSPTPTSGFHNPGNSCIQSGCHTVARASVTKPMTIAGTLYGAIGGGAAVSKATIHAIDANGVDIKMVTTTNGNFWSTQTVAFPIKVRASLCPNADQPMISPVTSTQGSCNACHGAGNRIHLP
jgi:hypothetical protein